MDITQTTADLAAEHEALDEVLSSLEEASWGVATSSPGWTVADQVGHLAYYDQAATTAIVAPDAFAAMRDEMFSGATSIKAVDDRTLEPYRRMSGAALLQAWRDHRKALLAAVSGLSNDDRVEWYGPSMSSRSFATARLMEAWTHGRDVLDALDLRVAPTDRLWHIARLGFITRDWSYRNRRLEPPSTPAYVGLDAPSGRRWEFGDPAAVDRVDGDAEDFCLVVTQRRHLDDTDLSATPGARDWLVVAQAFAGPATTGPAPRTRT
ncbi:MAG: TIGR03084 family protein [Actinobacteria bacterium]|nr:TIGR03084 family protein [Actinomycetota bacterium]MCB9390517.1 TIGR03084 family protein [Acidimicrobiia bacterium]